MSSNNSNNPIPSKFSKTQKNQKNANSEKSDGKAVKSEENPALAALLSKSESDQAAIHLLLNFKDGSNRSQPWEAPVAPPPLPFDQTKMMPKLNPFPAFPFPMTTMSTPQNMMNPLLAQLNANPAVVPATSAAAAALVPPAPITPSNNPTSVTSATAMITYNILQHFEPRFMQVFQQYQQFLKESGHPDIAVTDHLVSLCLEHMIPFCFWARKNASTTSWIKATLDDSPDLRPEVRNGISAILIYCFAAAQAKARTDSDMFLTLQDSETGLGIVNKTSLKIYNDPFNYFNFVKSCITGLIDAGKIPENERVNNQPKKFKSQAENKEEIAAFHEIRKIIVDKLAKREHEVVREKVQQISNVWYRRQNIRSCRFSTALAILTSPDGRVPLEFLGADGLDGPSVSSSGAGGGLKGSSDDMPLLSPTSSSAPAHPAAPGPGSGLLSSFSKTIVPPRSSEEKKVTGQQHRRASSDDTVTSLQSLHSEAADSADDRSQATSHHGRSSLEGGQDENLPSPKKMKLSHPHRHPSPTPSGAPSSSSLVAAGPSAVQSGQPPFVLVLRFDRLSLRDWQVAEMKVFDIDNFLAQHPQPTFFLLDEAELFLSEPAIPRDKRLRAASAQTGGMISLLEEFQGNGSSATRRKSLVTSWSRKDHRHLQHFLECWLSTSSSSPSPSPSLLDLWSSQNPFNPAPSSSGQRGRGVIAYEVTVQVGLVLRKNEELGLTEDCWRLVYLADLWQLASRFETFGGFLTAFFPQLIPLLVGQQKHQQLLLKYCAHSFDLPVQQPPALEKSSAYQTVGLLHESTEAIFSR